MSNKALNWAWEAPVPAGPKLVLVALADHATDHAGEDWTCFPSNERLTAFTSLPPRTLERHISWLAAEGWISRDTPRKGGKMQVRHYVLHREKLAAALGADAPADAADDASPPAILAGGDHPPKTPLTTRQNGGSPPANMAGGLYIAEPPIEPSLTQGARARADAAFDRVVAMWPADGLDRTNIVAARETFWDQACEIGDPEPLVRAATGFVSGGAWRKGSHGAPSLNTWLTQRRWEGRLREADGGGEDDPASVETRVPAEVLNAFAAARGSDWTASWAAPCRWDETTRTLHPRTSIGRERLRDAWPREAMAALDVRLGEVMRADAAAGVG